MTNWVQRLPILVFIVCSCTSCLLVPAYASFKRAGMTADDRKELLSERVTRFHESLYWGRDLAGA